MLRFDRRLIINFDWVLLLSVVLIAIMGLTNLYSASLTGHIPGTPVYIKQLYFFLIGFVMIIAIISVDYKVLLSWNYPLYILAALLLLFSLIFGHSVANTQRWINFGFFHLQPSEPAKLTLVITLASYYYRKDTARGFHSRN